MDRKFVIALSSLAGSLMLSEAHAIGLGEIRLHSSLNEPLRADIKLVQVGDLSENEIIVSLAPKEDFDRARVDREFLLNSLRFRLDLDDPKNPKVVVTTQQPLREPFLNFLVEVQWPSGRLLREYTLLMDLPVFSSNKSSNPVREASVPAGRAMAAGEGVSEFDAEPPKPVKSPRTPKPKPSSAPVNRDVAPDAVEAKTPEVSKKVAPVAEKEAAAPVSNDVSTGDNTYGPTRTNDTMWRIAQGVRGSGSIQQKMLAVQRLNPGAFSNNNVNQLKKGQVLKLPSQEEIASIGRAAAITKFEEQNAAWKSGRPLPASVVGAPLDATSHTQAPAPVVTQPDGQLKLAAPATTAAAPSQAAQGSGDQGAAEVAALQNDLSVGMEELNRAQRENQEIASRAKDLDAQKENAERLLQLQSNEMAAMQAKLAADQQAKAAADAAAQAAADAQAKATADAQAKATADAQQAAATATPPPAIEATAPATTEAAAVVAEAVVPAVDTTATTPAAVEAVPPPAVETAAPVVDAAPVAVTEPEVAKPDAQQEPAASTSVMDSLTSNSMVIGVIAVVVVLLGLFGYRRKASRAVSEVEEDFDDSVIDYTPPERDESESYTGEVDAQEDHDLSDTDWEAPAEAVVSAEAEMQGETLQAATGDVLGEADIYISFGNFDKGEALLKSAIKAEPSRSDYRVKLLELYKESGNLSAFDETYKDLIDLDDDFAIARAGELRGGISGAATTPFAFGVSSAAAAAGISDEVDFDLDLDMDFDAPAEEQAIVAPVAETSETAEFFDVDFDLDSEPEFAPNQTSIREAVSVDVEEAAEEEFSLDFDLDLESPALDIEPEVVAQVAPVIEDEPEQYSEKESAMLGAVTADAGDLDEELDFLSDADESATKLDLARAYIDMGDKDGARDILAEVLEEGRSEQKREAQALLDSIG
jgi:pilus assembly protein FimV